VLKEIHEMKNEDLLVHLRGRRAETLCSLVAEELERIANDHPGRIASGRSN